MTTEITKLWNKNFIVFVIGRELSMLGKSLLRFALPLYILLETGNPILMGTILAASAIPSIIFSPLGGVMADRFNKRKLLAIMNFTTAIAIIIYLGSVNIIETVPATIMMMIALLTFESLISLTTKASIPVLVPVDEIIKANSVTFLLSTFSSIGTPILGGLILALFGLMPILFISITLHLLATIMNFLTNLPFTKQERSESVPAIVLNDIKAGIHFISKEKPEIGKVIFGVNMLYCITLMPLMSIALPVLVTIYFERGEATLGITQAIIVLSGVVGVILIGVMKKSANITKVRFLLFASSITLLPTGIAFMWSNNDTLTYLILIVSLFIISALSIMMSIICRSFFGEKSSEHMVGKVMALNSSLVILGTSIGGYLYGFLFNHFIESPEIALFILTAASAVVALRFKLKQE